MRFDEFVATNDIVVTPVNQFTDLSVTVVLPPDWAPFEAAPFDSMPGKRVWNWSADPMITQFGANAVLSLSSVEASLDPGEVFSMLCEWQVHMLEGSLERHRHARPSADGLGVVGDLIMEIRTEFGLIGSESITRIIPAGQQTLIAQLTISALCSSPVDRAGIRLIVTPGAKAAPSRYVQLGGAPAPLSYEGLR